jgi:hypothetical protein
MQVPWTKYRFNPPEFITEGRFIAVQTRVSAHRFLVFDELRRMFLRMSRLIVWGFVMTMSALAVALIIQDSELKSYESAELICRLAWILVIGGAISLTLTISSFIGFALQYIYYWERVIAVAAICKSHDEFLEEALERELIHIS